MSAVALLKDLKVEHAATEAVLDNLEANENYRHHHLHPLIDRVVGLLIAESERTGAPWPGTTAESIAKELEAPLFRVRIVLNLLWQVGYADTLQTQTRSGARQWYYRADPDAVRRPV